MQRSIDERPYVEILDGVEYEKVSPNTAHSVVQVAMTRVLNELCREFGMALTELHTRVGRVDGTDSLLVPDIAFFRSADIAQAFREDQLIPQCAPEVAIEIRSPNDRRGLREKKIAKYLGTGSVLVLDVDPKRRRITAHANGGVREYTEQDRFEHAAEPWMKFNLVDVFSDLDRYADLIRRLDQ